jgi:hypothetical protein
MQAYISSRCAVSKEDNTIDEKKLKYTYFATGYGHGCTICGAYNHGAFVCQGYCHVYCWNYPKSCEDNIAKREKYEK